MRIRFFLSLILFASGCTSEPAPTTVVDPNLQPAAIVDGKPQFRIRDLRIGKGKEAKLGSRLKVHYRAWLFDLGAPDRRGKEFETTREADKPFVFVWGEGGVIRGWEQGMFGFQQGGLRELTIPAESAFGATGDPGKVPPNTPVIYEIELLELTDPPPAAAVAAPAKHGKAKARRSAPATK